MAAYLDLSEFAVFTSVRQFLQSLLPVGTEVVRAQTNRVPAPKSPLFVYMTPLLRTPLSKSIVSTHDVLLTGSIAEQVLTVTALQQGRILPWLPLIGPTVTPGTRILPFAQGSGNGGLGTYLVSPAQTVAETSMKAGSMAVMQPTQLDMQIDFYGLDSGDAAQTVAAVFQTEYAVNELDAYGLPLRDAEGAVLLDGFGNELQQVFTISVAPLYAGVARNIAFVSSESQYQARWSLDVSLQINPIVYLPQEFADQLDLTLVDADLLVSVDAQA